MSSGIEQERQAINVDRLLVGRGIDVAVWSETKVEIEPPRAARPDCLAEAVNVARYLGGRVRSCGKAKMIVRLLILLFHEQGARQLEPDAQQPRVAIENAAEQSLSASIITRLEAWYSVKEISFDLRVELARLRGDLRDRPRREGQCEREGQQRPNEPASHPHHSWTALLADEAVLVQRQLISGPLYEECAADLLGVRSEERAVQFPKGRLTGWYGWNVLIGKIDSSRERYVEQAIVGEWGAPTDMNALDWSEIHRIGAGTSRVLEILVDPCGNRPEPKVSSQAEGNPQRSRTRLQYQAVSIVRRGTRGGNACRGCPVAHDEEELSEVGPICRIASQNYRPTPVTHGNV